MYAVIRDGSKQYRVEEGRELDVDLRPDKPGETLEFSEVLLVGGDGGTAVGTPTVPNARVLAQVKGEHKGKKLEVVFMRRRKSSRRHTGHRQRYTRVAITKIIAGA